MQAEDTGYEGDYGDMVIQRKKGIQGIQRI